MKNGWYQNSDYTWSYYDQDTMLTGWFDIDDTWFYSNGSGVMQIGWVKINDTWYYFHRESDAANGIVQGEMAKGWLKSGDSYYYLNDKAIPCKSIVKGAMRTGWLLDGDKWYYLSTGNFGSVGRMLSDCKVTIDGKDYTFNTSGAMLVTQLVTLEQLKKLSWIKADQVIDDLNNCLKKFDITTPARIRHFISQCAHESGVGYYMTEEASGNAYEGRSDLGNTQAGDGPKFKGGGYIQITGRTNYQRLANYLNDQNVMQGCRYVADNYPWTSAGYWWHDNNMNTLCDAGADVVTITKRVNGGTNGLASRQQYYAKCCNIF